ncbi:homoserine O-succinyltransferase [Francisella sp. Scap27]|uniref:homoserine O-acetyltransferase/O-succinyltransferase family protein n=1 Tax=Francisella sp. Scap27 TaxID=2589986 RepID=UPI0015B90CFC|nr:homoserine O-succinyltransferase [Francisella sp. Scap27]QLE79357.1 homoserine O-succinyltransferase [Francisella sp. Scap27]
MEINRDYSKNSSVLINDKSEIDKHTLRIAVLNLMPTVQETEHQWQDLLSYNKNNSVEVVFFNSLIRPSSKVDKRHIDQNYSNWEKYDFNKLDGIVITGAPVELLDFNEVDFYPEVCKIIAKSIEYNLHLMLICWAAQAALHYLYAIDKCCLDKKLFGVYEHKIIDNKHPLFKNFNKTEVKACISRQTKVNSIEALKYTNKILSSEIDGLDCLVDKNNSKIIYMFNHLEYTEKTLEAEFVRDLSYKKMPPPYNYYQGKNNYVNIKYSWKDDRVNFYSNWIDMLV